MDIASLIAKRELFRLWIVTPLALLLVLGASAGAFKNYKVNALAEQEMLYNIIPQIETTLDRTEEVLKEFSSKNPTGIETGDEVIALLNKVAEKENFNLLSAGVETKSLNKKEGIGVLEAHVQGAGNIASIIKFMDTVLNEDPLLAEADVQLRQSAENRSDYTAIFIFKRLVTN